MSGQYEQEYRIPLSSIFVIQQNNAMDESFGKLVYYRQQTGFQKWGFVIYRCAYGDSALWQRYPDKMEEVTLKPQHPASYLPEPRHP
jgi:hypothetical protein